MVRNYCTFLSASVDDAVEVSAGRIILPPGRILVKRLAVMLSSYGDPFLYSDDVWEFIFFSSPKRKASVLIQGYLETSPSERHEWLVIVKLYPKFTDIILINEEEYDAAIRQVDDSLYKVAELVEIKWQSEHGFSQR